MRTDTWELLMGTHLNKISAIIHLYKLPHTNHCLRSVQFQLQNCIMYFRSGEQLDRSSIESKMKCIAIGYSFKIQ